MADDLKRFLYKKLPSVEGLHAIVVSDRDGVPVIKGNFSFSLYPTAEILIEQQGVETYSRIFSGYAKYLNIPNGGIKFDFYFKKYLNSQQKSHIFTCSQSSDCVAVINSKAGIGASSEGHGTQGASAQAGQPKGKDCFLVANDNAPEHALRPGFLSTFALATDQGSKLGLSKNKSIICYYNTYQVVQFNRLPLVVSFIASSNANTGLIVSLEKELTPLFEELRQVVEVS